MKKIKVKKISLKYLFLGIIALSFLPLLILSVLMLVVSPMDSSMLLYCMTVMILGPILYGGIAVLFGLGYNWLSPKIGQFEIQVELVEDETTKENENI
ncbi:hypothetical protein [Niameybacter massiliensis]|uniref:hypothetical protein n=1 Tax=Niameybacter massiliensis TaxID=1658108 RepID=UPI0006B5B13E|nr:hypothetical protein [Niameybacter massiliensis]